MPTKGDRRWGSFLVQITLKFWNIISMHRSNKMASTPSKGYVVGGSEVASVWCPWCDQTKHTVWLRKLSAHNIKHTSAPVRTTVRTTITTASIPHRLYMYSLHQLLSILLMVFFCNSMSYRYIVSRAYSLYILWVHEKGVFFRMLWNNKIFNIFH